MASQTRLIMGMPITVTIAPPQDYRIPAVFQLFEEADRVFSPYKPESELSRYNRGEIPARDLSVAFQDVLNIAAEARRESGGYFNIRRPDGRLDPCGVVKGWAIARAAEWLHSVGCTDFCLEAGGDIQTSGSAPQGGVWRAGIRNPFDAREIVKVVALDQAALATSGSYSRGDHIYDPVRRGAISDPYLSLSVLAGDILTADLHATAAFAMGRKGMEFLEDRAGVEAYAIDARGQATMTSGFRSFVRT